MTIAIIESIDLDAKKKEAAQSPESRAKIEEEIAGILVELFKKFAAARLAKKVNSATEEQMILLKQFELYQNRKKFEPKYKRLDARKKELRDGDEYTKSNPFGKELPARSRRLATSSLQATSSLPPPTRLPPPSRPPSSLLPPNGGKSRTRRYNNRRKTLRRKTLRRKTLRRKTLRKKTLRRKTLRRKKYYKN